MKHKICFLICIFGLAACGVELKEKEKQTKAETATATEPQVVVAPMKPDYVINETLVLKEHANIETDRLVLTKNALIITEDKNLVINAKEVISEGAIIRNFPEGQRAFWEAHGRSGGSVTITAQNAKGNLNVFLQGEAGGLGKNGCITFPGKHPGCAGTTGGNGGNAGSLRVEIFENNSFNLSYQNEEGPLGTAGVRGSVPYGTENAVYPPCDADTPNGIDGKPGSKGQICLKLGSEENFRCN